MTAPCITPLIIAKELIRILSTEAIIGQIGTKIKIKIDPKDLDNTLDFFSKRYLMDVASAVIYSQEQITRTKSLWINDDCGAVATIPWAMDTKLSVRVVKDSAIQLTISIITWKYPSAVISVEVIGEEEE